MSEREISGLKGMPTERWEPTSGSALAPLLAEWRPCSAAAQTAGEHGAMLQASIAASSPLSTASTPKTESLHHPYLAYSMPSTPLPSHVNDSSHHLFASVQNQTSTPAWSDDVAMAQQPEGDLEENDSRLSCEYAASIITAMKYDASALQIKQELGCGENTDCKVDHTALFEMMDKYSGDT